MTGKFKVGDRVRTTKAARGICPCGREFMKGTVVQTGVDDPYLIIVRYEGTNQFDRWHEDYWDVDRDAKDTANK